MRYSDLLKDEDPLTSLSILMRRINKGKTCDDEIANFIGERILLEEKYSKDLLKLSRKQIIFDEKTLGNFSDVFKEYINVTSTISKLHKNLAKSLADVEKKLKSRLSVPELTQLKNNELYLKKQAKIINEKNSRIRKNEEKYKKKNNSYYEKKLNDSIQDYQQAKENWATEVTPFYDNIEREDEKRLRNLKMAFQSIIESEKNIFSILQNINDTLESKNSDIDEEVELDKFCIDISQGTNSISDNMSYKTSNSYVNGENRMESRASSIISKASSINKSSSPIPEPYVVNRGSIPVIDEEGYSIPPPVTQPWSKTEEPEEMDYNESDDRMDGSETMSRKLKIEIKNEAIKDEAQDTKEVITQMANSLSLVNPSLGRNSVTRRRRTITLSADEEKFRYSYSGVDSPVMEWKKIDSANQTSEQSIIKKSGMKVSIKEKMNALISNDIVNKLVIFGDVFVSFSNVPEQLLQEQKYFKFRINNYQIIRQIVPNPNYVKKLDTDNENEYTCDLSAILSFISQNINSSIAVFKYQINIDNDQKTKYMPLYVNPIWKSEPTSLSLLLAYQMNNTSNSELAASEIRFFISLFGDIRSVKMKPTGIWNQDKKRLIWQDNNLISYSSATSLKNNTNSNEDINNSDESISSSIEKNNGILSSTRKLMAKFETGEECPIGNINVQFNCNSILSNVEIEVIADNDILNIIDLEKISSVTNVKYMIVNDNNQ